MNHPNYIIIYTWEAWRAVYQTVNKDGERGWWYSGRCLLSHYLNFSPHKGQVFMRKTIFPFLRRNLKVSKIKFHTKMGVRSREISNCFMNMRTQNVKWQYFLLSSLLSHSTLHFNLFLVSWERLARICLVALSFLLVLRVYPCQLDHKWLKESTAHQKIGGPEETIERVWFCDLKTIVFFPFEKPNPSQGGEQKPEFLFWEHGLKAI